MPAPAPAGGANAAAQQNRAKTPPRQRPAALSEPIAAPSPLGPAAGGAGGAGAGGVGSPAAPKVRLRGGTQPSTNPGSPVATAFPVPARNPPGNVSHASISNISAASAASSSVVASSHGAPASTSQESAELARVKAELEATKAQLAYEQRAKTEAELAVMRLNHERALDISKQQEAEKARAEGGEAFREIRRDELSFREKLGAGGFGKVYRAIWQGKEVAVKTVKDSTISREAFAEFRKEIAILSRLRHPNIVLFLGGLADHAAGELHIVTEYLAGGSLFDAIHKHRKPFTDREVVKIALNIALGVCYLHNFNPKIMHRDLKSPNILLDEHGNAKIADFGLSKTRGAASMTGEIGTPQWTAPEILRNVSNYTEKVDVYSLGILFWELVTRQVPYKGLSGMVVAANVHSNPNFRPPIPPSVRADWAQLITWCWKDDPSQRPTIQQIVDFLNRM